MGFNPLAQNDTSYEADALPPSHHGWMGLTFINDVKQNLPTSFESSLFFSPYELQIESCYSARSRVNGRSRAGVPVSFPFQIPCISILMRWREIELVAGFDLAPFPKNVTEKVVRSSPRPQCLGDLLP